MVEHRRTKNKHDPNKAKTRMMDPHPTSTPRTSHPHQHSPTISTIPRKQRQQGRMHRRPNWSRKRILERHRDWETQNIPVPRHVHSRGRIQPRSHQNHAGWLLHPKRSTMGQKGPPQTRPESTTRIQILCRGSAEGEREQSATERNIWSFLLCLKKCITLKTCYTSLTTSPF